MKLSLLWWFIRGLVREGGGEGGEGRGGRDSSGVASMCDGILHFLAVSSFHIIGSMYQV